MGRLTTLPSCQIHTESSILSPSFKTNRNVNLDVIPENRKFDIKSTISETLGTPIKQLNRVNSKFHINILYLSLTISILMICGIVIRFRNKIVKSRQVGTALLYIRGWGGPRTRDAFAFGMIYLIFLMAEFYHQICIL
ncbi:Envelope fusion protein [Aphis craccivora]|uniref:Envelope fusion protein n=1 Tax=Aphis craccivora TaxID=307492 RepID=A0A6G0XDI4_APHCR|nr:Envelope fusion protein [Aphis craccivora]